MTHPDLRSLFRTNTKALAAADLFADRDQEWQAVRRSLKTLVAARRDPLFDVDDMQVPRQNALVFYGVGGIGKSTLSRQITRRLAEDGNGPEHWPPVEPELGRILPVRVDLSRQMGVSIETVMLAMRLKLAELGQPAPAFDLAFNRYWTINHPGELIEEHLRRRTFITRWSSAGVFQEQMSSVLADVVQGAALPGTIGSLTGQSLRAVIRALRERRTRLRALARCRRLPDLLEADPDQDALPYYAHLLAWDLAQLPEEKTAALVVLLDTFEDIGSRTFRDKERLFQQIIWLMPNTLFIITGRNRLQWDERELEGQLDWVGKDRWPGLVPGATIDPHQYRVGYFSQEDCEVYLQRRLLLRGKPVMDAPTRRALARHSQGLPLYLDLAVLRFLDLFERTGHAPAVTEFQHDFPAMVARIFRDLTRDERQVLRAGSLLDSFSVELATAAAGMDRDAAALQLVDRPFIETTQGAIWPYNLHDLVRQTVRDADSTSDDRWSPADWRRAAERAFEALGTELAEHANDSDRRWLLGCLRQGLRLAREFHLPLAWLADAAFAYISDFVWEPMDIGSPDGLRHAGEPVIDSPSVALAETLTAISRRQRQNRALTAATLRTVLDSGQLPSNLVELPRYFLAECERDLGHLESSMEGMRKVADSQGRLAADATRGLLHLARRVGRFPLIPEAVGRLGGEGKSRRVLGDLWWTQGAIALSCESYARSRDNALATGKPGEAALSQACLAFAASFQDQARATEQIERAERMLVGLNARFAELQVLNARILSRAGSTPALADEVEEVVALAVENGMTSCVAYARFAACFGAAIMDSPALMLTSRAKLAECVAGIEFAYLIELSYYLTGDDVPAELPRADWIDGAATTHDRWRALVVERRQTQSM